MGKPDENLYEVKIVRALGSAIFDGRVPKGTVRHGRNETVLVFFKCQRTPELEALVRKPAAESVAEWMLRNRVLNTKRVMSECPEANGSAAVVARARKLMAERCQIWKVGGRLEFR